MGLDYSTAVDRLTGIINELIAQLPSFVLALIVFTVFYLSAKVIRKVARRATEKRRYARNAGLAVGRLAQGFVVMVGLLVSLSVLLPSFRPADIVGILGIGSVAIGFAFRDILQNFLAGILLLVGQFFRIGDQIVVGGFEGTVEDIQTRATFIRTYDGRRVIIPNAELFTTKVTVNTAFKKRRIEYDVSVGTGDDPALARELIVKAMEEVDGVLNEPSPDAIVMELADFSVKIRARWWIKPPFISDVFHDQTEETDGDRARQREGWPPPRKGETPRPMREKR